MELVPGNEEDKFRFEYEVTAGQSDEMSGRKVEIQSYDCGMEPRNGDMNLRSRCLKGAVGEVREDRHNSR